MRLKRACLILLCCLGLGTVSIARAERSNEAAPPSISQFEVITPDVAISEKFEVHFDVQTVATDKYMPYDADPPAGVPPGIGVTVDALFSADGWKTTITQPAFWYQAYDYTFRDAEDHFVPKGGPRWAVRFAPQSGGAWAYRVRVTDRNGGTLSPPGSFFVSQAGGDRYDGLRDSPYSRNGFVRVSKNDARYFEFQKGAPFHAQGYNVAFYTLPRVEEAMRAWQENGINFVRVWLSGSSINGAAWTSWSFPSQPTGAVALAQVSTTPGDQFALYINNERRCVYSDFHQEDVPVLPETKYHVVARVKLKDVKPWSGSYGGLAIRAAGFTPDCVSVKGIDADSPVVNGTMDWTTIEGDLTTRKDQYWLPFLWLILDKAQGEIWIDDVRMYRTDDPAQVNILREPRAESVYEFDPMNSFKWDQFIEAAEHKGIYLKLVTDEKDEWIRNHLAPDGGVTDKPDNDRFYAAPDTQVRWLDQAWWRYLIARWGYSTAIHSFEFVNEGDPFLPLHYEAANAMAKYFHQNDPSKHLVTTSFWHSYPGAQFWGNPAYADIDYADLHAYILTGWGDNASFVPPENLETRSDNIRSAPTSLHLHAGTDMTLELTPRGLHLNEQGEWTVQYWMKGKEVRSRCGEGSDARLRWVFDDGLENGSPQDNKSGMTTDIECAAPAGTFDWQEIRQRIGVDANTPREFHLLVSNNQGVSGDVWIDDVQLASPSGRIVPILGSFDPDSFTDNTAWYTAAYSELLGANSPVAARMPLVRAEGGINSKEFPNGMMELNQDQDGIWLHNLIWGQINAGGMYELYWWGSQMIENNPETGRNGDLFGQYRTFQEFIWDIPINNGEYKDAGAVTDNPNLRVWGQRDDKNGRAHLWVQNRAYTWKRVVNHQSVPVESGIITLGDMKVGTFRVEWWDTRNAGVVSATERVKSEDGTLTLTLPAPLGADIGVKIQWIGE